MKLGKENDTTGTFIVATSYYYQLEKIFRHFYCRGRRINAPNPSVCRAVKKISVYETHLYLVNTFHFDTNGMK